MTHVENIAGTLIFQGGADWRDLVPTEPRAFSIWRKHAVIEKAGLRLNIIGEAHQQ